MPATVHPLVAAAAGSSGALATLEGTTSPSAATSTARVDSCDFDESICLSPSSSKRTLCATTATATAAASPSLSDSGPPSPVAPTSPPVTHVLWFNGALQSVQRPRRGGAPSHLTPATAHRSPAPAPAATLHECGGSSSSSDALAEGGREAPTSPQMTWAGTDTIRLPCRYVTTTAAAAAAASTLPAPLRRHQEGCGTSSTDPRGGRVHGGKGLGPSWLADAEVPPHASLCTGATTSSRLATPTWNACLTRVMTQHVRAETWSALGFSAKGSASVPSTESAGGGAPVDRSLSPQQAALLQWWGRHHP